MEEGAGRGGHPHARRHSRLVLQSGMWFFLSLLLAGVTAFGFAMFYSQRLGDGLPC